MAKEEREYTAEVTATVVVYARTAQEAIEKVTKQLDKVCSSHDFIEVTDENGDDVTDGNDPEEDDE